MGWAGVGARSTAQTSPHTRCFLSLESRWTTPHLVWALDSARHPGFPIHVAAPPPLPASSAYPLVVPALLSAPHAQPSEHSPHAVALVFPLCCWARPRAFLLPTGWLLPASLLGQGSVEC